MKTISVCIVNYNARELLRDCLDSIIRENPSEIIVVDNASTDGSVGMITEEFPSLNLVRLSKNIGYGSAANRGVEKCRLDYVLLLNSDTIVKPGAFRALIDYLEAHESAAIIGPRIINPDGTPQTSCFHFPTPLHILLYLSNFYRFILKIPIVRKRSLQASAGDHLPAVVPWVLGAALAFRREEFASVGGFDESFFMYFEEVDLCYRLARKGRQTHYAPVAEIIHIGGASTQQQRDEMNMQYFASLARYYRKHYSWIRLVVLVLIIHLFALIRLVQDATLLSVTRDKSKRAHLMINLKIYQRLLLGQWDQQASRKRFITV